ncbi:type II toxin-antitoxin system HicA family toxin [bacterium]|jgi:predicted RNA binding protein YcfA (HicA-like mRNA interferase family)|nr:type II toxin-antitoxin system HicA family toxin [bacterium]
MSKLPLTNAKRLEKILKSLGFTSVRQKGSHVFYRHPDGRYTTIPHHQGSDLARPLIRKILKEAGISFEDYITALKK